MSILSALTSKAAIAIAATALAAGTASVAVPQLASSDHADVRDDDTVEHPATPVAAQHDDATLESDTEADAEDTTDDATDDASEQDHADNFGAIVSDDAHDGGVDGQEISDMARARNEARHDDDGVTEAKAEDDDEAGEDDAADATEADDDEAGEDAAEATEADDDTDEDEQVGADTEQRGHDDDAADDTETTETDD